MQKSLNKRGGKKHPRPEKEKTFFFFSFFFRIWLDDALLVTETERAVVGLLGSPIRTGSSPFTFSRWFTCRLTECTASMKITNPVSLKMWCKKWLSLIICNLLPQTLLLPFFFFWTWTSLGGSSSSYYYYKCITHSFLLSIFALHILFFFFNLLPHSTHTMCYHSVRHHVCLFVFDSAMMTSSSSV